jgi:hypothetical protein
MPSETPLVQSAFEQVGEKALGFHSQFFYNNKMTRYSREYIGIIAALLFALGGQEAFSAVYEIGPGRTYVNINDFPWEQDVLDPGDTVLIYYKATPYREKWTIGSGGTAAAPITIRGVPDANGNRPVIDGENATTRMTGKNLYWGEVQAVIRVGDTDYPAGNNIPNYVRLENLEVANGHSDHTFTDDMGSVTNYRNDAAAVIVRAGTGVIIRNCIMRDSCNGLTTIALQPTVTNLLLEGCYFLNNGKVGFTGPHSVYIQGGVVGMTVQYCRFGPPLPGSMNNSYKDRAARTVFRYNWVEDGSYNLALVEGECAGVTGATGYNTAYVYGNLIHVTDAAGSKVVRFGGDMTNNMAVWKTNLYFYNNTIISTRTLDRTRLFSTWSGGMIDARNNIFYVEAGGAQLAIMTSVTGDGTDGLINLRNNWLSTGWIETFETGDRLAPGVIPVSGNIDGISPLFFDYAGGDYLLTSNSACRNAGIALAAAVLPTWNVTNEYVKHLAFRPRADDGALDMGAYEYVIPVKVPVVNNGAGAANITTTSALLQGYQSSTGAAAAQVCICWGRSDAGTNELSWPFFKWLGPTAPGAFSTTASNLASGARYYYRCFASNSFGTAWAPSTTNFMTVASPDSDGDGILDTWEISNFSNLTMATAVSDYDKDGFLDWQEAKAGTAPKNSNDLLKAVGAYAGNNTNALVVAWSSVTGKVYSVTRATNHVSGAFMPLHTNFTATSSVSRYTDTNASSSLRELFYRIVIP